MKEKDNNIKDDIINQIKEGKVKLRSKYIFLAEKIGLNSTIFLSVLLSTLFFSLILFYLQSWDVLGYLAFGRGGFIAFLEAFPYPLVISFVLLILITGYILRKAEFSYKKSFSFITLVLLSFVFLSGTIMAYTDVSEKIDNRLHQDNSVGGMFRPFVGNTVGIKDRGVAGRLVEIRDGNLELQTPHGIEEVSLDNCENCVDNLQEGDFVIGTGKREGSVFRAEHIKGVRGNGLGAIKKKTNIRFGYWECRGAPSSTPCGPPPGPKKRCARECLDQGLNFEQCRERCIRF